MVTEQAAAPKSAWHSDGTLRAPLLVEPSGHVDHGDRSIPIYDSGNETASPTIVLVHGTSGTARGSFQAVYPILTFTRRVVAFDLQLPAEGELTLAEAVDQLRAVVEHAAAEGPVALVGYSFGAVVAAAYASTQPETIASLSLVAGWSRTDRHQLLRNDLWQRLHESDPEALSAFGLVMGFSPGYIIGRNQRDWAELQAAVASRPFPAQIMRLNREIDIESGLGRIHVPTLVIGCKHDAMVPLHHSRMLFGAISDARYLEIDSGHGVVTERPAELAVAIDDFTADPREHAAGTIIRTDHA
ncbi:alpha/beta hydrolase [Agrococcus sp. ProA11]|uniref:alpha/beta fold hydrolase n=1 Tax=Agrococcus chionoecetis TaxID=3153752 RepID=UPI003260C564